MRCRTRLGPRRRVAGTQTGRPRSHGSSIPASSLRFGVASVQLDRVPPCFADLQLCGTPIPAHGVPQRVERRRPPEARPRAPLGAWALMFLVAISVLGQGERAAVDHRFATAIATLQTYWAALAADDVDTASECLEEGPYSGPYPGMVWFLPPTR